MGTCVSHAIRKNKGKEEIAELTKAIDRFIR